MLVDKIVFYEAMRKVYPGLPALSLPVSIMTGEQLRTRLNDVFARAMKIDYETVFTEELVKLVNEELDSAQSLLKDKLAVIDAELNDVGARLSKLYDALETSKLSLDDLSPRIKKQKAH
jgi:hypothetical protein